MIPQFIYVRYSNYNTNVCKVEIHMYNKW